MPAKPRSTTPRPRRRAARGGADQDLVFVALADAGRRTLLDALRDRDGQSLIELQPWLPKMTRFGVMKHLRVLAEAGLINTRKAGRRTLHYLNPVPIQTVYERWVSRYMQPFAQALTGLKHLVENTALNKQTHVYSIYIRATAEKVWQALTDGQITPAYYYGTILKGPLEPGTPYTYTTPEGQDMVRGEVLVCDPPHKLVTTFQPLWTDGAAPISRVTFDIAPEDDQCKLTLIQEELEPGTPLTTGMIDGWARILSNLKSLLEQERALAPSAAQ